MLKGYLYCITNTKNHLKYYGIAYRKKNNGPHIVDERFKEHLKGNGGVYLYKYGVKEFGPDVFNVKIILISTPQYVRALEPKLTQTTLWPNGYNGNCGRAIYNSPSTVKQIIKKRKKTWNKNGYKPIPPNWKGKHRSKHMCQHLRLSKIGHTLSLSTRQKISQSLVGRKQSFSTKKKRKLTLSKNPNAYGRQTWVCVSPDKTVYIIHSNRNQAFKKLNLVPSKGFYENLNSGKPCTGNKKNKNKGWMFFNDHKKYLMFTNNTKYKIINV